MSINSQKNHDVTNTQSTRIASCPGQHISPAVARVALQVMEAAAYWRGDRQTEQRLNQHNRALFNNPQWQNFLVEDTKILQEALGTASHAARAVGGVVRKAWKGGSQRAEAGRGHVAVRRGRGEFARALAETAATLDRHAKQPLQTMAGTAQAVAHTLSQRAREDWQAARQAVTHITQDICDKAASDRAIARTVLGKGSPEQQQEVIARLYAAAGVER